MQKPPTEGGIFALQEFSPKIPVEQKCASRNDAYSQRPGNLRLPEIVAYTAAPDAECAYNVHDFKNAVCGAQRCADGSVRGWSPKG